MKLVPLPPELSDVFRRRVSLAPKLVLKGAFKTTDRILAACWSEQDFQIIAMGEYSAQRHAERMFKLYGNPFPGVEPDRGLGGAVAIAGKGSFFGKLSISGFERPVVVDPGGSALIGSLIFTDIGPHRLTYTSRPIFVARASATYGIEEISEDYDNLLTNLLAPFVERVADVA